jgi:hypothetical protein
LLKYRPRCHCSGIALPNAQLPNETELPNGEQPPNEEEATWIDGRDVIPVPSLYFAEFRRDPRDSLLKFGGLPQRSRAPWFTRVEPIEECMVLPDRVSGPTAELADARIKYFSLVGAPDELTLLNGIDPHFYAVDEGYWHVHIDNALGKNREGDSAGIAMGRISHSYEERALDALRRDYIRIVNTYEVPLVAQIVAPPSDQIYISAIIRLILQLKQLRGFNITSFSVDGFESAEIQQQLMLAGMVTAGMIIDPHTGQVTGLPKPWSVDRSPQPYKDLLEAVNEVRVAMPNYPLLLKELKQLEFVEPGKAPDHPLGDDGSKDVADPVAGVIGYLAAFGHYQLMAGGVITVTREDLERQYNLPPIPDFGVPGEDASDLWSDSDALAPVNFGLEPDW